MAHGTPNFTSEIRDKSSYLQRALFITPPHPNFIFSRPPPFKEEEGLAPLLNTL